MHFQITLPILLIISLLCFVSASSEEDSKESSSSEESSEVNNTSPQDLYVIKTIVYEVGILTDAGNETDLPSNETHEQVDVSFFDPHHNGSVIDLSKIPLPIQTNVSGVSVTGILPSNLGSILLPSNGTAQLNGSFPIIPNKQIKVTQNISTDNPEKGSTIVSSLPQLLGLDKINTKNGTDENAKNAQS